MNCVYCGEMISEKNVSKEHIIQNALGGVLESNEICCNVCNTVVRREVDDKFCTIFNPVLTRIKNMKKTNNSQMPSCKGRARYIDGKIYNVIIKNQIVIDCPEYKKANRKGLGPEDLRKFEIIDYLFEVNEDIFEQGISKIAFNFAMSQGVPTDKLEPYVIVQKNKKEIERVIFNTRVIPFVPLNAFDHFLELESSLELTHTLILFNHENYLMCYVDLFNTFQNFIVLSERWDGTELYKSYHQIIKKMDRSLPDFEFRRVKHIHTMATIYGVEPTLDIHQLKKDITVVVNKNPYARDIQEYIFNHFSYNFMDSANYDLGDKYRSVLFYLDEDERLIPNRFRRYTLSKENNNKNIIRCYPEYILDLLHRDEKLDPTEYREKKMIRLNEYLSKQNELAKNP